MKISASSSFFICRLEHTCLIQMAVTAVVAKNIDFLPSWSTTESEKFTDLSDLIFSVISSIPQESCYKSSLKNKSQNKKFKFMCKMRHLMASKHVGFYKIWGWFHQPEVVLISKTIIQRTRCANLSR